MGEAERILSILEMVSCLDRLMCGEGVCAHGKARGEPRKLGLAQILRTCNGQFRS